MVALSQFLQCTRKDGKITSLLSFTVWILFTKQVQKWMQNCHKPIASGQVSKVDEKRMLKPF